MPEQPNIHTPENWSTASKGYAEHIAPMMMETFAEAFVQQLGVSANTEALEVAAGSGALTSTLASKVKSLLATDFSSEMIELTKEKVKSKGLDNVTFAVMDGQALNLKDNAVDVAACSFGLMLFPDKDKGFSELNRVVRPNGKVLVSGWATPDKFETFGLFMQAIQKAFPDFPKPESVPPIFSLADLNNFKNQMESAGFQNVETVYMTREVTISSIDKMWAMLSVQAPPVKVLFNKIGEEGKKRIYDALTSIVQERFGNSPITLSNTATVGVGKAGK